MGRAQDYNPRVFIWGGFLSLGFVAGECPALGAVLLVWAAALVSESLIRTIRLGLDLALRLYEAGFSL